MLAVLARWFAPLIRPMFSSTVLREALAFGLPRVPHAAAQQITAVGDKFILPMFTTLENIGIYSMSGVVRADAEAVPERVRVGVGAVLLRDDPRAGRAARVPHGDDLRDRDPGAADGGTVGGRPRRRGGDARTAV